MMPTQKLGIDCAVTEKNREKKSSQDDRIRAERMPSNKPTTVDKMKAENASSSVAGSRLMIRPKAGSR